MALFAALPGVLVDTWVTLVVGWELTGSNELMAKAKWPSTSKANLIFFQPPIELSLSPCLQKQVPGGQAKLTTVQFGSLSVFETSSLTFSMNFKNHSVRFPFILMVLADPGALWSSEWLFRMMTQSVKMSKNAGPISSSSLKVET